MKYLLLCIMALSLACGAPQKEETVKNKEILSPAGVNSEDPVYFTTQEGNMGLSWLEKNGKEATFKFSVYKNSNWTEPKTLVSGESVLTNWADFPGIQTNGANWVAWFLQMNNPDTFAYDVMVMQSSDNGKSWSTPKRIHSDSTITEHGFVSAVPAKNGFQVMWLDGRLATSESPIFTVRAAHLNFNGDTSNRVILDDNTCTCCQTSMLNTGDDNFIALYRDRTDEEIRDIAGVNFNNEGGLEEPQIVFNDEWHISGCPVNGPRSVMNGTELGVVWFTMGKDGVAKVKFVTSTDGGKTYSKSVIIDEKNLGRVDVLSNNESYFISYIDQAETGGEIKVVEVKDRKIVNTFLVTNVSSSRKTGFPRMALTSTGDGIYVAYTDVDSKKVVMKYLDI